MSSFYMVLHYIYLTLGKKISAILPKLFIQLNPICDEPQKKALEQSIVDLGKLFCRLTRKIQERQVLLRGSILGKYVTEQKTKYLADFFRQKLTRL